MKKQRGFTLIELLVVITIIGILSVVGLTSYKTANQKARNSRREADIQAIRSSLEAFMADKGVYPTNVEYGNVFQAYFASRTVPVDPNPTAACPYSYNRTPTATQYTLSYCTEPTQAEIILYNP